MTSAGNVITWVVKGVLCITSLNQVFKGPHKVIEF